jgi:hypothetical protein
LVHLRNLYLTNQPKQFSQELGDEIKGENIGIILYFLTGEKGVNFKNFRIFYFVEAKFKLTKKQKQSSDLYSLLLLYPVGGHGLFLLHPAGGNSLLLLYPATLAYTKIYGLRQKPRQDKKLV